MDFEKDERLLGDFFLSAVESGAFVIFWIDLEGRIVLANEAPSNFLGYSKDELGALTIHDMLTGFDKDDWSRLKSELMESGLRLFDSEMKIKKGDIIPVEVDASHLRFKDNEYICFYVHDIIERRRVEHLLRLSQSNLAEAQRLAHPQGVDSLWNLNAEFTCITLTTLF